MVLLIVRFVVPWIIWSYGIYSYKKIIHKSGRCRTGDKCIKDYNKCDGVDDCVDKSDELDCDSKY